MLLSAALVSNRKQQYPCCIIKIIIIIIINSIPPPTASYSIHALWLELVLDSRQPTTSVWAALLLSCETGCSLYLYYTCIICL